MGTFKTMTLTKTKKQGYNTTGRSHKEGVKNEQFTADVLNKLEIYTEEVILRGGTRHKEDAVSGLAELGFKLKKGNGNGSFDWGNLGKQAHYFHPYFTEWKSKIAEWRTLPDSVRYDEQFHDMVEQIFANYCNSALDQITGDEVIQVLQEGFVDPLYTHHIWVRDSVSEELYRFMFKDHPAVRYIENGFTARLVNASGLAKTSRKIVFSDGSNDYECGLRFRLTSNNGISAFLGAPKKSGGNKNGSVTIKLQQDGVRKLLSNVNSEVYNYSNLINEVAH
jgi:hypothetical protein